jgi:SAM-dependent methyltransferase
MNFADLLETVRTYYDSRLQAHGPTHRGVDWNSSDSQRLRFAQLLRVADPAAPCVVGDYGCGYGALLDYLREQQRGHSYRGYDLSAHMIDAARRRHPELPAATFSSREDVLAGTDFVVASGLFNVKQAAVVADWHDYVLHTIARFATLARRGFAFNVLSHYADHMRPDLYYADPCLLFDLCKRRYSRHVSLLHDYGLYEFTILVRY